MTIQNISKAAAVCALLLCLTRVAGSAAQNPGVRLLDSPLPNEFQIEDGSVVSVLAEAARASGVPVGLEGARDPDAGPKVSVDIRGGTMRDALEAVVRQDTRYEWRVVDGVINVYPKAGRDDLLPSLLETPVRDFSIVEGTGRKVIQNRMVDLPEVKAKLEAAHVTPRFFVMSNLDVIPVGARFSLAVRDTTLRGLLNRIVRDSTAKFWVLRRDGADGENLILNF